MEPIGITFPPNIAPGEAILAVVGVRPLLTKKVERITAPMWREIARLDLDVARRAQQLVRGTLERQTPYEPVDYEPTLKAFSRPPDPVQIEAMLQDIPDDADLAFLATAARAYNYLRGNYPIAVERTIFGANQLEPGPFALGMFEDLLEIVDQPLAVFNMAASGRLTTKMAAAMQTVYPTLYQEVVTTLVMASAAHKAEHPAWDPDFARGMSVLLGAPDIDPVLRAALQAPAPEPEGGKPQQVANRSRRARLIATKSDRLELDE